MKENKQTSVEYYKNKLELEFKKGDVSLFYDKYKNIKETLRSYEVAKNEGYVKNNAVVNVKEMNKINWIVRAINMAKDRIASQEVIEKRKLDDVEVMQMLDYAYECVINDIAVNWSAIKNKSN